MPEAAHQPVHALPQRPGLVDHGERPADQEHEENHRGRVGHAARDGDERLERPHGAGRHGVIGARDDDLAARSRILPAVVLTGWEHVAGRGVEQHAAAQQRQGVGELHGWSARRRISWDSYTSVSRGASRATRTMARATVSVLIGPYLASGPTNA